MMPDQLSRFSVAVLLFVPAVLLLDHRAPLVQFALGLATTLFLALFVVRFRVDPAAVLCAIGVATAGELLLSVGWGLYEYREAVLPLYVPPGHGVFYALAAVAAAHPFFLRHAQVIVGGVIASGCVIAVWSLVSSNDVWGVIWWVAALALLLRSNHRLLLAACFVNATLLEWLGTYLGNWSWAPVVPGLGLASANPPAGVGLLYVLLDVIVVEVTRCLPGNTAIPASSGESSVLSTRTVRAVEV